mgnify:CR=1 FL=1
MNRITLGLEESAYLLLNRNYAYAEKIYNLHNAKFSLRVIVAFYEVDNEHNSEYEEFGLEVQNEMWVLPSNLTFKILPNTHQNNNLFVLERNNIEIEIDDEFSSFIELELELTALGEICNSYSEKFNIDIEKTIEIVEWFNELYHKEV